MSPKLLWTLRLTGVAAAVATAIAVLVAPHLLWITVPIVCVWAIWLVYDYLQWARTLGR
jgi:hypothetical protein